MLLLAVLSVSGCANFSATREKETIVVSYPREHAPSNLPNDMVLLEYGLHDGEYFMPDWMSLFLRDEDIKPLVRVARTMQTPDGRWRAILSITGGSDYSVRRNAALRIAAKLQEMKVGTVELRP